MIDGLESADPSLASRAKILDLTLGVVRARRRTRQGLAAAVVVGAYVAGAVTMFVLRPSPAVDPTSDAAAVTDDAAGQPGPALLNPRALESRAVAMETPFERATLLRAAGDRYLSDQSDVAAALRCYRELLKLASSDERTRSDPSDTWLLAALKRGSD